MDLKSFMMEGIDGEFNFLPEGCLNDEGSSPSAKSVNNEAPSIDLEPITVVPPSRFTKNNGDSDDAPSEKLLERENKVLRLLGMDLIEKPERCHLKQVKLLAMLLILSMWIVTLISMVVAHVIPPSWKQHLKEIILDKLCDIHNKAYMWQREVKNMLNRRTRNMLNKRTHKLMSTLSKERASCDAIQEREVEKDKAYAELERKCNEAL
ncbi:hypothetical protein Tco_1354580 [Tanacetum coccineum]